MHAKLSNRIYFKHLTLVMVAVWAGLVSAQNVTWNVGSGTWDTTTANWTGDSTTFTAGDNVTIGGSANITLTTLSAGVAPGTILFNNSANTITMNPGAAAAGWITSAGAMSKSGAGTVVFDPGAQTGAGISLNHTTTSVTGGILEFRMGGATSHAFGSGDVTVNGGTFRLSNANSVNGTYTFQNDIDIGASGGTLNLTRTSGNPRHNITGDMDLQGNLTATGGVGDGQSSIFTDWSGTIALTGGNRTINWQIGSNRASIISGNITQDASPRTLTFSHTGGQSLTLSGDNTGLTGGILVPTGSTSLLVFNSENSLGGGGAGNVTVQSGAYLGLGFSPSGTALAKLNSASAGVLGLTVDTNADIDLSGSGLNADLRIGGGSGTSTYTGTLTPNASTYRLGGGSGGTLILANANALTGANSLDVGTSGSVGTGIVALTAANDYSGGTVLSAGGLSSKAQGALGSGPITHGNANLFFETVAQTVGNDITFTGNRTVTANAAATYGGTWASGANNVTLAGSGVHIFDQTAGFNLTTSGGRLLLTGALDPLQAANLSGKGVNLNGSGVLVLSSGMTFANFTSGRTLVGADANANEWRLNGGGFAARGSDQIIGSGVGGINSDTFNRNFTLGSAAVDGSGAVYANAAVDIAQDTLLTDRRTITLAATGPGLAGTSGVVHSFSGDFTDNAGSPNRGNLSFTATGTTSDTAGGEIILSGANSLTGSRYINDNNNYRFNSGPGGMIFNTDAIVRFDGQTSLPTGNGGNLSWLAATRRNTTGGRYGYMLTGTTLGETYDLSTNQKFLIGGELTGIFGSTGGVATLENSSIVIAHKDTTSALSLNLLVRDGTLNLGSNGNAMAFETGLIGNSAADNGINAAADNVTDTTTADRTIIKRGEGTAVLGEVAYRHAIAGTDNSSNFFWQIGRGTGSNSGSSAYFDGAVRGLAPSDPASDNSNSLKNFFLSMRGGVYEIDNSGGNSGTFNATVATSGTGNVSLGNTSGTAMLGGGGFSAFGGNVLVDLNTLGTRQTFTWSTSGSGFIQNSDSLLFGSQTANARVEWYDHIALNNAVRNIRVTDNPDSAGDLALISGDVTGNTLSGLNKAGEGRLELSGANTYGGVTTVQAGTLALTGGTNVGRQYIVNAGASFIQSGGTWVMGNSADNLFHVNGSGATIEVADLADANDGSGVIRYTVDPGGVSTIHLTDGTPFGQYGGSAAAWAGEWQINFNTSLGLSEDDFLPTLTLMSSTPAYNLTGLNGLVTLNAWNVANMPTVYANVTNGQTIFISSGGALAEYEVLFTPNSFQLNFLGSFAIPEPGTFSLVALALLVLRRQFRKRCLAE